MKNLYEGSHINLHSPLVVFFLSSSQGVIHLYPLQCPSLSVCPCGRSSLYYDLLSDTTAEGRGTFNF